MLPFIAALMIAATPPANAGNLPGVFEATCLDGEARFRAGEATAINFEALPKALQDKLGHPSSGQVLQLSGGGRSYVYMLDYSPGPGISPKICGVASDAIDLNSATSALGARLGSVDRGASQTVQWVNVHDGYVATVTTATPFNVLQINWLSDADREAAQIQAQQVQR